MIKFNLYCDGQPIRSLEDLRENFNIDDIYEDYQSGKLVKWLQSRNYEREYIQIERINSKDKKAICDKLCVIFGVAGTNVERPRDLNESDIENRFLKIENAVAQLQQKFNDLEALIKDDRIKTNSSSAANNANVAVNSCLDESNIKIGDVIKFGKYPQSGNGSLEKSAIEWQVLDVESKRALLISKCSLDAVPFDANGNTNKWSSCSLRTWLNSYFFRTAFSGEEAKQIATTNVEFGVSDRLFLLNVDEVNKYFVSNTVRKCKATDYAKANGAYTDGEICSWWLRSAGDYSGSAAVVNTDGFVSTGVYSVDFTNICVHPVMWVNI
ncbi:MAG: DUF6273 domain-containing protein [Phascolarctobacterium sp.]|nr:DUF6273 domain-containing protein [Phascolarctobacterium sp.]